MFSGCRSFGRYGVTARSGHDFPNFQAIRGASPGSPTRREWQGHRSERDPPSEGQEMSLVIRTGPCASSFGMALISRLGVPIERSPSGGRGDVIEQRSRSELLVSKRRLGARSARRCGREELFRSRVNRFFALSVCCIDQSVMCRRSPSVYDFVFLLTRGGGASGRN